MWNWEGISRNKFAFSWIACKSLFMHFFLKYLLLFCIMLVYCSASLFVRLLCIFMFKCIDLPYVAYANSSVSFSCDYILFLYSNPLYVKVFTSKSAPEKERRKLFHLQDLFRRIQNRFLQLTLNFTINQSSASSCHCLHIHDCVCTTWVVVKKAFYCMNHVKHP